MDGLLKSYQVENLSYTTMSVLLHCVQSPVKPFSFNSKVLLETVII